MIDISAENQEQARKETLAFVERWGIRSQKAKNSFLAFYDGDFEQARQLFDDSYDIGYIGLYAVRANRLDILQELQNHQKFDINFGNGLFAIEAASFGYLPILEHLRDKGCDLHTATEKALRQAAEGGHLDCVKLLHQDGADLSAYQDEALCNAAYTGRLPVVQYLVENNANIHAKDNQAFRWAVDQGHEDVAIYLCEQGADIHVLKDIAIETAAVQGSLNFFKYMMGRGFDIKTVALKCFHRAMYHRNFDVARYILSQFWDKQMVEENFYSHWTANDIPKFLTPAFIYQNPSRTSTFFATVPSQYKSPDTERYIKWNIRIAFLRSPQRKPSAA